MPSWSADVVVIGAGPAGLAAAIAAKEGGARHVVVLDRNDWLGGILLQCIHDGFGIETTGQSLTGPEYAHKLALRAKELGVELMSETMVLEMNEKRRLIAVNRDGLHTIHAGAIVLSSGCREKTRWSALIPGTRPKGVYTAGVAQGLVNLHNKMVGKKVIVLGSGNVGLIMARRMFLEGAKVIAVVEILPYATGLPRNVLQCLEDYGIPLYLGHTITKIHGKEALEKVTIAQVGPDFKPIDGTEQTISCDTLLISLGLIPENELARSLGIQMDPRTGGPVVNESMSTDREGFFACGNCLHVHDTVDVLVKEAAVAGAAAAQTSREEHPKDKKGLMVRPGKNVAYVVPQRIDTPGTFWLALRPKEPVKSPLYLRVLIEGKEEYKKRIACALPSTMIRVNVTLTGEALGSCKELEVSLDE
jgi:thioredoxin reductase